MSSAYARQFGAREDATAPEPEPKALRLVFNKHHGDAPPDAVYVGRGSPYGNPFVIGPVAEGKDGTRDEVIAAHASWVQGQPALLDRVRSELAGRAVVCFCFPAQCHGDTLVAIANSHRY